MFITVKNVDIENKGKYTQAVVTYMDKGEEKKRNVVSFGDSSDAYHELKNAKDGDTFNIELKKDGKYWNWVGAARTAGENKAENTEGSPAKAAVSYGRDFETAAERAAKQVYIVRQSSITASLHWMELNKVETPSVDQVIDVAKAFEAYVFSKDEDPS